MWVFERPNEIKTFSKRKPLTVRGKGAVNPTVTSEISQSREAQKDRRNKRVVAALWFQGIKLLTLLVTALIFLMWRIWGVS